MRIYAFTLASALSFFTYGMVICGALLAYYGLMPRFEPVSFTLVLAASLIAALVVLHRLIPHPARGVKPSHEGLRWTVSFVSGFAVAYAVAWALAEAYPGCVALTATAWYLGLALSFLAIHTLWEKWFIKRGVMAAPPFLVAGLLMLASYSVVVWATLVRGWNMGNVAAMGLSLLCYYAASAYALLKANEVLFRGEGAR